MEKKNTVLLTVIAVATLLVAVVGATFAYFTATTESEGAGESANVNTTTVGDVELKMSTTTTSNTLDYPGGFLVVGAKVDATATSGSYNTTYTVNGSITNNTTTPLTWTLYETTAAVGSPVSGCTVKEDSTTQPGETRYWYEGCTVDTTITGGTNVTNGTVAGAVDDGSGAGTMTAGTGTVTATGETLATGSSTYYYLVVSYPNSGNQDADQGKTISASLTSITNGVATTK